ncbi:hypothetical protein E2C01_028584 [Portunus trituberculatus]|uniref:Uncharacterized protein n=1 Tax=Portunus trituberculatus TaxID=210409 RepID=A0A5B7EPH2_PORTR|nr:hypothetical protein [Portunus trituberculatus]
MQRRCLLAAIRLPPDNMASTAFSSGAGLGGAGEAWKQGGGDKDGGTEGRREASKGPDSLKKTSQTYTTRRQGDRDN